MLTLYDYELSGNCYKVRLLLSMLELAYETHVIEFYPAAEHQSDAFLAINPMGELPVLQDDDFVVRDSQAILTYLACRYDESGHWYPTTTPTRLAHVAQWLAFAQDITATASAARLVDGFFFDLPIENCRGTPDHRRHRLFPLHHVVRRRRDITYGLPSHPALD